MNNLDCDSFWENLSQIDDIEDGVNAVRLLAEMYTDGLYMRNGDFLIGTNGGKTYLNIDDQHLMRRIIEAVDRIGD